MQQFPNIETTSQIPESMNALRFGDQFLVWCVRTWALSSNPGEKNSSHYVRQLRQAFEMAGLAETYLIFDRFMTMFTASLKKSLVLHSPGCSAVCREELFFVCLVADAQNGMLPRAAENLETLVAPAGARLTLEALSELSNDFVDAGILLDQVPAMSFASDRHPAASIREDDDEPAVTVH